MKTTTKYISETKVELTISVGAEALAAAEQVALKRLARDVKVAGFRKGRVPLSVAQKHVNPMALQEQTLENALSKAVAEAFLAEKLQALDRPEVEVKTFEPGEKLEFTAVAEIIPAVKLGDYKKLKTKRPSATVSEADVDEIIERMRENFAEKTEVERAAAAGDEAVIDFTGKKDGEAFDGGAAKEYALKLGAGQFIPGFEEGVAGHKAGESFTLDVTFPADYHAKELAGQLVQFDVVLHKVLEVKLPEVDDEFAAKCGPFTSADELRADVKREILAQKEREADEQFKDELVGELTEKSQVALPELLISDQMRSIEQDMMQNLAYRGVTLESYLETQKFADKDAWLKTEVRPAAEKRVKAGLVLAELSKELRIEVSRDELATQLETFRAQYGKDEATRKQLDNPEVHRNIANRMVTDKTIDELVTLHSK